MDLSEKKNMVNLIVPLREIFEDPRRSPQTILLAGKNLCTLVKNESDILHRIKLADEGNLLKTISLYMDIYDYDEKLVLCCLDLFMYIMKELRSRLFDCLYAQGDGLMPMFIKFFSSPKVPGVYYSQRIMNKVLTILLPLTSIEESEMREMFNKPEYCAIYDLLLNIINLNTREYVIDPLEEESSVLEFKIYWLLCVLCAKNERAQDYLFTKGNLKFIIEDNSVKYRDQLKRIIALKDKLPDTDKRCIGKKIYKFCEFIYYLLINNEFRVKEFMREMKNFNEMKKFAEVRIIDLVPENEMKSDVFNMLTKIYKRIEEKYD